MMSQISPLENIPRRLRRRSVNAAPNISSIHTFMSCGLSPQRIEYFLRRLRRRSVNGVPNISSIHTFMSCGLSPQRIEYFPRRLLRRSVNGVPNKYLLEYFLKRLHPESVICSSDSSRANMLFEDIL